MNCGNELVCVIEETSGNELDNVIEGRYGNGILCVIDKTSGNDLGRVPYPMALMRRLDEMTKPILQATAAISIATLDSPVITAAYNGLVFEECIPQHNIAYGPFLELSLIEADTGQAKDRDSLEGCLKDEVLRRQKARAAT